MTTGERLVQISTLATGIALDHFLNISTGGGGVELIVREPLSGALSGSITLVGSIPEQTALTGSLGASQGLIGAINDQQIIGIITEKESIDGIV